MCVHVHACMCVCVCAQLAVKKIEVCYLQCLMILILQSSSLILVSAMCKACSFYI